MIIKSIHFDNFRAYYGVVNFDFPVDGQRNISIIFANNDVGKSCFFSGLLFCLYGPKDDLKDLINVNAQNQRCYQANVTIFADQDGEDIEITRTIQPRGEITHEPAPKDFEAVLTIIKDGKPLTNDYEEKTDYINSLIHEDAAQYFFFDGEKINDYSVANSDKYKDAIARILGIKEIENTIYDLDLIQKDFEKARDESLKKLDKYADILQNKRDSEQEVSKLADLIQSYDLEIHAATELIQKHEEELKHFQNKSEQVEKKQALVSEIDGEEKELKAIEEQRDDGFRKNASIILGLIVYNRIFKEIPEKPVEFHITSAVKDYLLQLTKGSRCACGEDMTEQRMANIQAYIDKNFQADDSLLLERERESLFRAISKYQNHANRSQNSYLLLNETIFGLQAKIAENKKELIALKKSIGSFDEEAGEKIVEDIARAEDKREETKIRRIETNVLLEQSKSKLRSLEAQLAQYGQANAESAKSQKLLSYTSNLTDIFQKFLDQLLEKKRKLVEEKATEVFMQITNNSKKYKGICIAKNYSLMLELTNGEKYQIEPGRALNPSTGQSKVISLSYIAGLNRSSNYAAPIVIDNPLGLFSDEHRMAITRYLPHFGRQIIFMVSSGDLNEKYHDMLSPYIKTEYYLENQGDQTWPKTAIADKKVY